MIAGLSGAVYQEQWHTQNPPSASIACPEYSLLINLQFMYPSQNVSQLIDLGLFCPIT